MLCSKHGVRLCTEVHGPRNTSEPKLTTVDGSAVSDFSWACNFPGSCWNKFHEFYEPQGLFTKTKIDLSSNKIKFASYVYTSDLYQKKYSALGIVTERKSMGKIDPKMHLVLGSSTIN